MKAMKQEQQNEAKQRRKRLNRRLVAKLNTSVNFNNN